MQNGLIQGPSKKRDKDIVIKNLLDSKGGERAGHSPECPLPDGVCPAGILSYFPCETLLKTVQNR